MTDSPLHLDHPDAPRIIVLGATGYAGSLVVDALVAQGARPVLAGRNRDSLQHAATRHDGLEVAVADAGDPASLRALVTEGDVLVSTVGPFERYGRPVARAAATVSSGRSRLPPAETRCSASLGMTGTSDCIRSRIRASTAAMSVSASRTRALTSPFGR